MRNRPLPSMVTLTVWNVPPAALLAVMVYSPASRNEALGMERANSSPFCVILAGLAFKGLPSLNHVTLGVGTPDKAILICYIFGMVFLAEDISYTRHKPVS